MLAELTALGMILWIVFGMAILWIIGEVIVWWFRKRP